MIRRGDRLAQYPGISFDTTLVVGEMVCVVLQKTDGTILDWREFPRALLPSSEDVPVAKVTRCPFHKQLSDPLGMAIATAVFGQDCLSKVPRMPDGQAIGTLEFSLVIEPGGADDVALNPPLEYGEVIDLVLRAPRPGSDVTAAPGKTPRRPASRVVATARYPRVRFPGNPRALRLFWTAVPITRSALEEAHEDRGGKSDALSDEPRLGVVFRPDAGYG